MDKLRGLRHKGRISAAQSSQSRWTGQYKKCVQYDFKFTSIHSDIDNINTTKDFLNALILPCGKVSTIDLAVANFQPFI